MTLHWLFHNYQRSILEALFESPLEPVCLSELAKRANVDPGNTKRYVQKFSDCGLVKIAKRGRRSVILPDLANPETRKIFELFELNRTKSFLDQIKTHGEDRVQRFTAHLVETLPDVRLIAMYGLEGNVTVAAKPVHLAVVVGSLHDTSYVHHKIRSVIDTIPFVHEFKVCVYTTDNLGAAWNRSDCGPVGFCSDRVVLFGESFYWRMVGRQLAADRAADRTEELVQNA